MCVGSTRIAGVCIQISHGMDPHVYLQHLSDLPDSNLCSEHLRTRAAQQPRHCEAQGTGR